jgi:hypothetical protein
MTFFILLTLFSFNPEGSGYDYLSAWQYRLSVNEENHWPSRIPETGLILKGSKHPTFRKTIRNEIQLGYRIYFIKGRYYSLKRKGINEIKE